MFRTTVDLVHFTPEISSVLNCRKIDPDNFVVWYELLGLRIPEIAAEYNLDESSLWESFQSYLERRPEILQSWQSKNSLVNRISNLRTA